MTTASLLGAYVAKLRERLRVKVIYPGSGYDIGDRSTVPIIQGDRRHFKSIGCLCVPGAFHPTDEIEFVGVDILTRPVDDRAVVNVNQQNLP